MNRNSIQASDYGTVRCVLSNNFGFQCGSIGPSSEAEAPNHNLLLTRQTFRRYRCQVSRLLITLRHKPERPQRTVSRRSQPSRAMP